MVCLRRFRVSLTRYTDASSQTYPEVVVIQATYRGSNLSYPLGVVLCALAGVCWSLIPLGIRHIETASVWQILFFRSAGLLPMLFCLMHWRSGGRPLDALFRAGAPGVLGGLALPWPMSAASGPSN